MSSEPCYNCKDRTDVCHSDCKRYGAFAKKREEIRKKRFKEKLADQFHYEAMYKGLRKRGKK